MVLKLKICADQRRRGSIRSLLILTFAVSFVASPAVGQQTGGSYQAPRLPGTQHPDFNGIWQALTTANWDILDHVSQPAPFPELIGAWGVQPSGPGIVEGNEIPYRAEALTKKHANFENRLTIDPQNIHDSGDPEAKCFLPGVPRAMYQPYPFQILQTSEKILMAFEFASASRVIELTNHEEAPVTNWMGWSNGNWDQDTLVVDVTAFNALAWLDRSGNFAGENLHVVERYTLSSPYHIQYEATIEDPDTFTRPWTISFPLYRRMEENVELLDMKCVEFTEDYLYGTLTKETSR
jgi:hypothetical protein